MTASLVDTLMLSTTVVYAIVTTIIMIYNINLFRATKNVQKQNIDLQLFEKRFDLMQDINNHFSIQFENINSSLLSLSSEFEIKNYSRQEIPAFKRIVQRSSLIFLKDFYELLVGLEQKTSRCFDLLKKMQTKYSELSFSYQGREYDEITSKMRGYFSDYYQDHLDSESLRKCLKSIGEEDFYEVFLKLENEYKSLNDENALKILNEKFENGHLSFLV